MQTDLDRRVAALLERADPPEESPIDLDEHLRLIAGEVARARRRDSWLRAPADLEAALE